LLIFGLTLFIRCADHMSPSTQVHGPRKESTTLIVLATALQLGLVAAVWLLALAPAFLAAMIALTLKTLRRLFGHTPPPPGGAPAW
jgi:hypothetical protein